MEPTQLSQHLPAVASCGANMLSAVAIVLVNKAVFTWYKFNYVVTLTFLHSVFSYTVIALLSLCGVFEYKSLPQRALLPLSTAFTLSLWLSNVSLQLNSVGFAQIMKIMTVPTIILLEYFMFRKLPVRLAVIAASVVCFGVAIATVTEKVEVRGVMPLAAAGSATVASAMSLILAGSKQRELGINAVQLLQGYLPQVVLMLGALAPLVDRLGLTNPAPGSLAVYQWTPEAVSAIFLTCILGTMVTVSGFFAVAFTGSLTFSVVSHIKTVCIIGFGVLLFHDVFTLQRGLGVAVAIGGIAWYTFIVASQNPLQEGVVKAPLKDVPDKKGPHDGITVLHLAVIRATKGNDCPAAAHCSQRGAPALHMPVRDPEKGKN